MLPVWIIPGSYLANEYDEDLEYVVPEEGSPIAITVLVEQSGGRLYASSVATDVLWTLFN